MKVAAVVKRTPEATIICMGRRGQARLHRRAAQPSGEKMNRTVVQYLSAVVGTVVGFFVWLGVYMVADAVDIDMGGGCKGVILVPIVIGVPLGCMLGIALVEKIFYKVKIISAIPALVVCGLLSIGGVIISIYLMDEIGGEAVAFTLFAPAFFAVLGYRFVRFVAGRGGRASSAP